ncbi:hypothetical protein BB561_003049, partial [Smittium simulii]
ESADELQKSFNTLTEWCKRWDMNVNNKKCGILAINCSTDTTFKIQNQLISSVKEYKYLGIEFNDQWNNKAFFKAKKIKTFKSYMGCYIILKRNDIPSKLKVMVIKAVIQAVATYGGKLFGMSATLCKPIQQEVDAATRTLAKCGKSAAMIRLRQELSLTDLNIKTAVARARAFGKWASLRTWISDLIKCAYKHRCDTWTARSYIKSDFIEKRFIEEYPFCKKIAPETIEHMLLKCSRWQALQADMLAQYINIMIKVATKPPLLPASISTRLVGKLPEEVLKLSSTRIRKDPTVFCVKTTLETVKFLNAIALPRYLMLNSIRLVLILPNQCPPDDNFEIPAFLKIGNFILALRYSGCNQKKAIKNAPKLNNNEKKFNQNIVGLAPNRTLYTKINNLFLCVQNTIAQDIANVLRKITVGTEAQHVIQRYGALSEPNEAQVFKQEPYTEIVIDVSEIDFGSDCICPSSLTVVEMMVPRMTASFELQINPSNNKIGCKSNSSISIKLTGIKEKWCRDW